MAGMRNSLKLFALVVGASALLSCGDDGDGGSCGAFTPCGGNVVGTWSIQNMCSTGSVSSLIEDCPGATTSIEGLKGSGTVTYNADMTMVSNTTLTGTMKMNVPMSCIMGGTCAQLDAVLKSLATEPDSPFSSASCTGSSTCACSFQLKGTAEMETGTYSISGNKITDSDGDAQDYCVSGDTLQLKSTMSMGGMMEDLQLAATLKKQ